MSFSCWISLLIPLALLELSPNVLFKAATAGGPFKRAVFVWTGNVAVGFVEPSSLLRNSAKTSLLCSRRLIIFLSADKVGCELLAAWTFANEFTVWDKWFNWAAIWLIGALLMVFSTEEASPAISSASRKILGRFNRTVFRISARKAWTKYLIFLASVIFNRRNFLVKSVK